MANKNLWTVRHEEAAQYIADGALTMAEIAEKVGVKYSRVHYWSAQADFRARVHAIIEMRRKQIEDQILSEGTARLAQRVRDRQELRDRLFMIIKAREEDPEISKLPGGKSGLVIPMHHKNGEITPVTDTALVSKIESLLRDTAKDKGEWVAKVEQVGALDMLRHVLNPLTGDIDMSNPEISEESQCDDSETDAIDG